MFITLGSDFNFSVEGRLTLVMDQLPHKTVKGRLRKSDGQKNRFNFNFLLI